MPKFEDLGSRQKFFEKNYGNMPYLMIGTPALCRIDGRSFHSFCKNLPRPFDARLSALMIDTTKFLMEQCSPVWSFVQSDEISLCFYEDNYDSQIFFDYRRQKIETQTAALATWYFNNQLPDRIPEKNGALATFDSRAWSVPTLNEASSYAVWRQRDATKNSITMAASAHYSHGELQGKNGSDKHELLYAKGVNWSTDYPNYFKNGTFFRKVKRESTFTVDELSKLPEKHEARSNPRLTFTRNVIECIDGLVLDKITNKSEVLFNGADPVYITMNNKGEKK